MLEVQATCQSQTSFDLSGATQRNRVTNNLGHFVGSRFLSRPTYAMENSHENAVGTFPSIDPLAPADIALRDELAGSKDQPPKKRSTAVSLDPKLLLSEKGLPRLRHHGRAMKFYGKGREDEDLKRIMEFYQIWAHSLYPRLNMKDFSERVVKLGLPLTIILPTKGNAQCMERRASSGSVSRQYERGVIWHNDRRYALTKYIRITGRLIETTFVTDSNETDDLWGDNARNTIEPASKIFPHDNNGNRDSLSPQQTSQLSEEQRRRIEENRLKALSRRNIQSNVQSRPPSEEHWDPLEDLAVGPEQDNSTDPAEEYVDPAEEYI
ncbi:hypothetical protein NQZ79_g4581 [Umbelopsis isabellina]|nr:hypothetical protein NQZ79_g4581 [Umbelopsis isabellina]